MTLHDEIRGYLAANGPSTSTEVALGVRRNVQLVTDALRDFPTVSAPPGRSGRGIFYAAPRIVSPGVPWNDTDYLAAVLADGGWHRLEEIVQRSQRERGHGLTVHSRAADLRKRGFTVEQRSERRDGRVASFYRMLGAAAVSNPVPPSGTDSGTEHAHAWDGAAAAQSISLPQPGTGDTEEGSLSPVPGQLVLEAIHA